MTQLTVSVIVANASGLSAKAAVMNVAAAGAWPDASNTGCPPGITLTRQDSPYQINTPGVTVQSMDFRAPVYINANDVTLQNCKLTALDWVLVKIGQNVTGATVQNCTLNGLGTQNAGCNAIQGTGTFLKNNIFNVDNGIAIDGFAPTLIKDNYIHDLLAGGAAEPHYDGIQIDGGGLSNITIEHNTIICDHDQTSAIMMSNYWGTLDRVTVNNNILAGGGYCIYCTAQFGAAAITNIAITNNHFKRGKWGTHTFTRTNPTFTGNVNDGAALIATLTL